MCHLFGKRPVSLLGQDEVRLTIKKVMLPWIRGPGQNGPQIGLY